VKFHVKMCILIAANDGLHAPDLRFSMSTVVKEPHAPGQVWLTVDPIRVHLHAVVWVF
jgi:hypothetical protein